MKIFIVLITALIFSFTSVQSEEDVNCKDYKISIKALKCNLDKAGKRGKEKMTTKEDGSKNVLGKWFNSKSLSDFLK